MGELRWKSAARTARDKKDRRDVHSNGQGLRPSTSGRLAPPWGLSHHCDLQQLLAASS